MIPPLRLVATFFAGAGALLADNPSTSTSGPHAASASVATLTSSPVIASNLALIATASTSFVSGHETLGAIQDGHAPRSSHDYAHGTYGNWPSHGTQWVQYDWPVPVSISAIDAYYYDDQRGLRMPSASRLLYWNQTQAKFLPVPGAEGLGVAKNQFNRTSFPGVTTTRLRLEIDPEGEFSTGMLEWRVYDSGHSPLFPPRVDAGPDRVVVEGGKTYLDATVVTTGQPGSNASLRWEKISGPGDILFADASSPATSAVFSAPGDYTAGFSATAGELRSGDKLHIRVVEPAPLARLAPVDTTAWSVTTPFWRERLRNVVINWIPHCVAECEKPDLKEGGINNLIAAADKLAGRPAPAHIGYPFSNAWVLNTLEAACLAQQLAPGDDTELAAAQKALREAVERWIPIVLAAQQPDGYFQTRFTLGSAREQKDGVAPARWSERLRSEHEGYVAGYFLEAAIAHYRMTGGRDRRLYDAARRLADCWDNHIGPAPKQAWFDGHQEMELALFRFAALVDQVEGPRAGARYAALGKFLLDSRGRATDGSGAHYDQTHLPVTRQYSAVGHAVRAVYNYTGMADVIASTGDLDYQSATLSLWNNLIDRKYYVTGGVGSGETSEGFGEDYSLPNNAYCESCANIGLLYFNHRLHLAYAQARYANLYEDTLYNAVLSDLDLQGKNFTYTNALDTDEARYPWHVCPCCVGNIARTLLQLPTWTYSADADRVFVNLFVGGTVTVNRPGAGDLRLTQSTDYPWSGHVTLTVDQVPSASTFALHVRIPDHQVSALYTPTPSVAELGLLTVNGQPVTAERIHGYAVIQRSWQPGDRVEFDVPLAIQRIRCDERVTNNRGRVALRYGPLIYNVESVDQNLDAVLAPDATLSTDWRPDFLGGVLALRGRYADGSALLAIPNYARNNRGGRSIVWLREK
ncbi:MAG: Non-reducing end beta-L-arabinofuranosidase [Verrucomicrobiota bacterium]